jgi:hypothetical protein
MKTLDQVEPRKELNAANTPGSGSATFVISQPGSYYLSANLGGEAGKNGIQIAVSGVTVDLMGFELTGTPTAQSGIITGAGTTNVTIRNGSASSWGQYGLDGGNTNNALLEDLVVAGSGKGGINAGAGSLIVHCTTRNNTAEGFGLGNGGTIKDCVASANGASGIAVGDSVTIVACTVQANSGNGITTGNATLVKNCVANTNGNGSSGFGIQVASRAAVTECVASQNRNDGIRAVSACYLSNNTTDGNGVGTTAHGIHTTGANNRIDSNHADDNSGNGIRSDSGGGVDMTVRNSARNNLAGNYSPSSGSTFGPIGNPETATSAWSNFFSFLYLLTVSKAGTGSGVVSSSPPGINCGTTCSNSFDAGTGVTLTAAADSTSVFAGWSGACTGSGSCTVTMDSTKSVSAAFNVQTFTLTVTKSGTGSGTVTSSPAGISCGATCSTSYNSGTVVTLTATLDSGMTFTGWSGACSGTGPCMVTMNGNKTATAAFN